MNGERHPASGTLLPGPPPLAWGVLGATSTVARQAVLPAIVSSPKSELVAVGSATGLEAAAAVAAEFGALRAYPGYDGVLADPQVEAVYIALPNHLHRPWTERAAAAGKHVLCEKPLAPDAAGARAMAGACRTAGVLLVEAYMTPFHPRSAAVGDAIRSGRLGELRSASCVFSFALADSANYRWDPAAGGGALLDVGVYCLDPLLDLTGRQPARVAAAALASPSGVDASFSAWLDFGEGFTANVWCSFEAPERQAMSLVGTRAALSVPRAFTPGPGDAELTLAELDGATRTIPTGGADPYRGMVDHVQTVLRGGARLRRPPERSIAVLTLIDRLRAAAATGTDPGAHPDPDADPGGGA